MMIRGADGDDPWFLLFTLPFFLPLDLRGVVSLQTTKISFFLYINRLQQMKV